MITLAQTVLYLVMLTVTTPIFALKWLDLWRTPDQQATKLLQAGKANEAARTFKSKSWQGVAWYRAHNFSEAAKQFSQQKNSDGYYNYGNAEAHLGRYQEALLAYDKAIALNANNTDAIANREIVKKLLKQQSQKEHKNDKNQVNNQSKNTDSQSSQNQQSAKSTPKDSNKNANETTKDATNQSSSVENNSAPKPKSEQTTKPDTKLNRAQNAAQQEKSVQANNFQSSENSQLREDQKQMLRRVVDDPGGLLKQKFLRDYLRRHAAD